MKTTNESRRKEWELCPARRTGILPVCELGWIFVAGRAVVEKTVEGHRTPGRWRVDGDALRFMGREEVREEPGAFPEPFPGTRTARSASSFTAVRADLAVRAPSRRRCLGRRQALTADGASHRLHKSSLALTAALCLMLTHGLQAASISLETAPPVVVKTAPVAGATDVDPSLTELRATFSKPMQDGGWSWSTWGAENFPEIVGKIHYESDQKTCVLPVKLQPGKFYATWLNSQKFTNFKDVDGHPAVPYLLTFTTAGQSSGSTGKASEGYEYLVQPGDTLSAIAKSFWDKGIKVTVDEILKANPGLNPTRLKVGQKIFIPAKSVSASSKPADVKAWVDDFFAHNFRDITSRDTLEWGEVETNANGNLSIRYEYRAKIWDKDTVTNNQVFTFDPQGKFVSVKGVYGSAKERMMALVEKFFANNYRDITSRETIEWGEVEDAQDGNTSIRYKYQAKIRGKDTITNNQVFTFDPDDKFVSVTDAAADSGESGELIPLHNKDQRAVIAWTYRQFRSYFDNRTFAGWSDEDLKHLELKSIDALNGPRSREYYQAINTLGAMRSTNALPRLREIAFERVDRNNRDRWMCVRVLGLIGDRHSIPDLIQLIYHGNPNTRWWAQISLVRLTGQNFGSDWAAWGNWWNESGGQPPYDPQIIRWWDGQPEADQLAESLAEWDRKFLDGIQPK